MDVIYEEYYDFLDKSISKFAATAVDDYSLTFLVTFAKPSDISTDKNDLDYLMVELLMPEQIVDAETFKTIDSTELKNEVKIER